MIIDKDAAPKIIALWLALALLASWGGWFLFPTFFSTLNDQAIDRIQRLHYALPDLRPADSGHIVHVDLNNRSLKRLDSHNPDRTDHAQVVRNLASMGVAVQMLDFVYAGTTTPDADGALASAVADAGAVVVGMALRIKEGASGNADKSRAERAGQPGLPIPAGKGRTAGLAGGCTDLLMPMESLAVAAAKVGFLTLTTDSDGVFRRLPLLVRCGGGFYPSFALAAVCHYLRVPLDQIVVRPGEIHLAQAQFPGDRRPRGLTIPIDAAGRMRVNYVGPWGRMAHYQFADIFLAARDQDAMEIWREELAGKIVLVSDITTGAADAGRTPLDLDFPLSGVHANAVHTILTESFLESAPWQAVALIDVLLLAGMLALALRRSAVAFTLATLTLAILYLMSTALVLHLTGVVLPVVQPIAMILMGMFTLLIASSVANTRTHARTETARRLAERDLDIGRRIQTSFLPAEQPQPPGWQMAAHFKPARQVAGDFYDIFELGHGRYLAVVVADVCDKGVGAALFMALIRSLIRAFAIQDFNAACSRHDASGACTDNAILNTIRQTNDYLAVTHGDTGMFATLFLGILAPESGRLRFVNCGHEPPWIIGDGQDLKQLMPTGPALGMMPDSPFTVGDFVFATGETFLAFTDGLTESESSTGDPFGRQRLEALVRKGGSDIHRMLEEITQALARHTSGQTPFDDITIVALRREASA